MRSALRHLARFGLLVLVSGEVALAQPASAPSAPAKAMRGLAVVGIVDGPAALIRHATRYTLLEGVRLLPDDIIDAPKGSVVQIEFADGSQLAMAESGRVMLQPQWLQRRGAPAPARAYLLHGWFKLNQPVNASSELASPGWTLVPDHGDGKSPATPGSMVFSVADASSEGVPVLNAFLEAGSFRITERGEPHRNWLLRPDDYFALRGTERPLLLRKPAQEFLMLMPAPFRDALPSRAGRYAEHPVPPLPQGDVSYADVAPWLRGEAGMRPALLERWRSRVSDPTFRAALQSNLAQHSEWEKALAPERPAPRGGHPATSR
ncbi:MAG: hypothetical protein RIQ60_1601 [Pseudomonadota bacterium]